MGVAGAPRAVPCGALPRRVRPRTPARLTGATPPQIPAKKNDIPRCLPASCPYSPLAALDVAACGGLPVELKVDSGYRVSSALSSWSSSRITVNNGQIRRTLSTRSKPFENSPHSPVEGRNCDSVEARKSMVG